MDNQIKDWSALTAEEKTEKVQALKAVAERQGLTELKFQELNQTVYDLSTEDEPRRIDVFLVEGDISSKKSEQFAAFKDEFKKTVAGINPRTAVLEAQCKLSKGDDFKDILQVNEVFGEKGKKDIKHEEGKVYLLDFWATWCPPCQGPMAHNQEMLEKNGERWGDKVQIIGLSIDQGAEAVQKHVEAKGWTKVTHYHCGESTCSDDYGVQGVPHVVLIDTKGKIVFVGHPASRKLEEDIETLLKGEPLKGDEDEDEKPKQDDAAEGAQDKEHSLEQVNESIAKIEEGIKTLKSDENMRNLAKKLSQGVYVIVKEVNHKAGSEKKQIKVTLVEVLFGVAKNVDPLKEKITALHNERDEVGKTFTVSERVRSIPQFSITRAEKCAKCEKDIKDSTQVHTKELYTEEQIKEGKKNEAYCEDCAKEIELVKLLVLPSNEVEELLEVKYVTRTIDSASIHGGVGCDGCRNGTFDVRYKCVTCDDYDLCKECYQKFELGEGKTEDLANKATHEAKKHPFYFLSEKIRFDHR